MKKNILFLLAVCAVFFTNCEKEYVEPVIPAPTFTFKKSTTYDDIDVKTPQTSVLMFEGDLIIDNPNNLPLKIYARARLLQEDTSAIKYSAIKSILSIGSVGTSKKVAAQSGTDFGYFETQQNGTQKVRLSSDISESMKTKMSTSIELTCEYQNPKTGVSQSIILIPPKGQIITLTK